MEVLKVFQKVLKYKLSIGKGEKMFTHSKERVVY
jgi:hypothetical protein